MDVVWRDVALFAAGVVVGVMLATVMAAMQAVMLWFDEQARTPSIWKWGE